LVLRPCRADDGLTPITTDAGEWLKDQRGANVSPILQQHAERGDWMIYFSVALLVVAVALAVLHWLEGRSDKPSDGGHGGGRDRRPRRRRLVDRDGRADRALRRGIGVGAADAGASNEWPRPVGPTALPSTSDPIASTVLFAEYQRRRQLGPSSRRDASG